MVEGTREQARTNGSPLSSSPPTVTSIEDSTDEDCATGARPVR
ncbi:hypothetical protein OG905_08745 [Streptomyces sp. NBC_00322]|nr:hypothetical protein [Streptomyces sp. NBC_00322]